jgi:hypothetical protein
MNCSVKICCRKVREAPVETEKNTEEIEVKEFQKSRKESKKEEARAEKYNKKGKTKQAGEETYVSQEKKKPKEQEAKSYKKIKRDEKQKRQVVKEVNRDQLIESNEAENEGEENVSCFPEKHNEENELHVESVPSKKSYRVNKDTVKDELDVISEDELDELDVVSASSKGSQCIQKNTAEDELDVESVPSKESHCINKNSMKDEIYKEEPIILQDDTGDENVPARKCYYK